MLNVSRSGYYAWKQRPKSSRQKANEELLKMIRERHQASRGLYGVRKITAAINRTTKCSKNRVHRLMKQNGIVSRRPRKYKATTISKHNYPVANNILNQNFNFEKPNQAWVADITYIPTIEGWLYLATIMDLCHRKIVGWSMDSTMTKELVLRALNQAVQKEKPGPGLIHHSDQGRQYASLAYQELLKKHGFKCSMSRKGNCYDNASQESFFSTLKNELIYLTRFKTRAEARQGIFEYIEIFYNRFRLHSSLGYVSPVEFEKKLFKNSEVA